MSIKCPVHNIPDCSPLLNGCTIVNYISGLISDALTETLHPEFGSIYQEPDGEAYKAYQQGRNEVIEKMLVLAGKWDRMIHEEFGVDDRFKDWHSIDLRAAVQ
jgi:hypothetical protein